MKNKTLLSSFILFSISIVSSMISLIFFYIFLNITSSILGIMCPAIYPNNCLNELHYQFNSNVQMHYFPGLIFYGISLFLVTAGIILHIVNFFRKRAIDEGQIDKKTKNDRNTGLLKYSFVIFVVVVGLLLMSLIYFIKFQGVILNSMIDFIFISHNPSNALNYALILLEISVFLSIIGIIIFAKYIFGMKKIME